MSEVRSIPWTGKSQEASAHEQSRIKIEQKRREKRREEKAVQAEKTIVKVDEIVKDLINLTSTLDKKLKFEVNRELGMVTVKVIDRATEEVIKEIPPKDLQKLHIRLREAIGILIDEKA